MGLAWSVPTSSKRKSVFPTPLSRSLRTQAVLGDIQKAIFAALKGWSVALEK